MYLRTISSYLQIRIGPFSNLQSVYRSKKKKNEKKNKEKIQRRIETKYVVEMNYPTLKRKKKKKKRKEKKKKIFIDGLAAHDGCFFFLRFISKPELIINL